MKRKLVSWFRCYNWQNLFIDTQRRGGTSPSYAIQDECWVRRNYDIAEIY